VLVSWIAAEGVGASVAKGVVSRLREAIPQIPRWAYARAGDALFQKVSRSPQVVGPRGIASRGHITTAFAAVAVE
jgi:hypothetical protein